MPENGPSSPDRRHDMATVLGGAALLVGGELFDYTGGVLLFAAGAVAITYGAICPAIERLNRGIHAEDGEVSEEDSTLR